MSKEDLIRDMKLLALKMQVNRNEVDIQFISLSTSLFKTLCGSIGEELVSFVLASVHEYNTLEPYYTNIRSSISASDEEIERALLVIEMLHTSLDVCS